MYLHLGHETIVKNHDIIGIFDMDNTTVAKSSRKFLNHAETLGQVVSITLEIPKSFVVVSNKRRKNARAHKKNGLKTETVYKDVIYLSQISSHTLKKRTGYMYKTDKIAKL